MSRAVLRPTAAALLLVPACSGEDAAQPGGGMRVLAGFYPLAQIARQVGGDAVAVTDLTPAGTEPHDLELTPREVDAIEAAGLVIVLGRGFQPAVEEAAARREAATLELLDALGVDDSPGGAGPPDPHVWLDPHLVGNMVDAVAEALAQADPEHRDGYRERAREFDREVDAVAREYERTLAGCDRDLLLTAHEAFGWLAARYGLRQEGLAGLAPEQEPDPARLAELADLARSEGATTVFSEPLVPGDLAETLAREAGGLRVVPLDPIEGLTDEQRAAGEGWASIMRANLGRLADGLGCWGGLEPPTFGS